MDKSLRKALRTATQDARQCLEQEFEEQLEGRFDIRPDGTIPDEAGPHLDAKGRVLRQKLVTAIEHKVAGGRSNEEAVAAFLREAAFTTLNRFAALKMLEVRGLVQECISRGEESSGFKEFTMLAPGLADLPDGGYRLYIESLFDEIGQEVSVLFDRQEVAGRLWPRRQALLDLIDILNRQEVADAWTDAEAIGWVYQYFNSSDERQEMRSESSTPRNSHELAVRNQFFTPHYVVQFLTDNSLGRTWYEMHEGETRLVETCDCLVQRTNEVFLAEGETPPENNTSGEDGEDEPTYVPHRPKKDPRALRVLDPACGSGHFLLYAFDLLWTIYEEAWEDPESPAFEETGRSLREDYGTLDGLQRALPGLILEHNLYGVDIDPRATQIAGFALWMRAQQAYNDIGLKRGERPPITKTNVVVAEPMPGEEELRKEFIESLQPPALGQLVEVVFDKMELADEAGTLLRIEEEIRDAIKKAKEQWEKPQQLELLPEQTRKEFRQAGLFDVSNISDAEFWTTVEEQVYRALADYAERGEQQDGLRRQLFADDAATGFAFVDLCRERYDVVLMNPPFGEMSLAGSEYVAARWRYANKNLICGFLEAAHKRLTDEGLCGTVLDRTVLIKNSYESFRSDVLIDTSLLSSVVDLGWEVLDANVEVSVTITGPRKMPVFGGSCTSENRKRECLYGLVQSPQFISMDSFRNSPYMAINTEMPSYLLSALEKFRNVENAYGSFYNGHTIKSDVFKRLYWETNIGVDSSSGQRMWNGSSYSPFYVSKKEAIVTGGYNDAIEAHPTTIKRSPQHHQKPGLCYGKRGKYLDVQVLPPGFTLTNEGFGGPFPNDMSTWYLLGWLNSRPVQHAINSYCGQHKGVGYVGSLPISELDNTKEGRYEEIAEITRRLYDLVREAHTHVETDPLFVAPNFFMTGKKGGVEDRAVSFMEKFNEYRAGYSKLDDTVASVLGIQDYKTIKSLTSDRDWAILIPDISGSNKREVSKFVAKSILSYSVGACFGRWDVRSAVERKRVGLPEPFARLPACPPGMLQESDGKPMEDPPRDYPITFPSDGILTDDPGHELDLIRRFRLVLGFLFDNPTTVENEACEVLNESGLRSYFRKTTGFFRDHRKQYSKSRRKAPIYWQLAPSSTDYSVWLYYPKLTQDTFYRVLDVVKDKVRHEARRLADLRQEAGDTPSSSQRSDIADQEDFVSELRGFRKEVERVAPLWNPNMNDGVVINYAPLWRLVQHNRTWQKECKKHWDRLAEGEYDWSHWAMHLWPERVVPKCAERRDLAIAHGLEDVFWTQNAEDDWVARDEPTQPVDELIDERTSRTVKSALNDLVNAPSPR